MMTCARLVAYAYQFDDSKETELVAGSVDYSAAADDERQKQFEGSDEEGSPSTQDARETSSGQSQGIDSDSASGQDENDDTPVALGGLAGTSSATSYAVFPYIPNPSTEAFIASIGEQAREIGQKEGLYASVMIAQAILESGSGSSGLSKPPYNNLFGIKGSYKGASVVLMTSEDDGSGYKYDIAAGFRRYPSVKESLEDYANLLKRDMGTFYAPAWKSNAKTYVQACNYLQGHYATDTTYSGKLQGLIKAYDLVRYDHAKGWDSSKATDAERAEAASIAFANGTALNLPHDSSGGAGTPAESSGVQKLVENPTGKGSTEEPLSNPGVQVSLLSLGALALFFSKNEIALLIAAFKANASLPAFLR